MSREHRSLAFLGFPAYRVGADGSVWSRYRLGRIGETWGGSRLGSKWRRIKPSVRPAGYSLVNLWKAGRCRPYMVHRLVLLAFRGVCPPKQVCRHLDGNPRNNTLRNLAYGTHKDNTADQIRHGTANRGERHNWAKLTDGQVRAARRLYRTGRCSINSLSRKYHVTWSTMWAVIRRKTWAHLSDHSLSQFQSQHIFTKG